MPRCVPAEHMPQDPVESSRGPIFEATVAVKTQRSGKAVAGVERQLQAHRIQLEYQRASLVVALHPSLNLDHDMARSRSAAALHLPSL
jgi:hypothetical protein